MQQHWQQFTFRLRLSASPRASKRLIRGNVSVRQMSTPGSLESLVMPWSVIESGCKLAQSLNSLMKIAVAPPDTKQGLLCMMTLAAHHHKNGRGRNYWASAGHAHVMPVRYNARWAAQLSCVQVRTFMPNRAIQIKGSMK